MRLFLIINRTLWAVGMLALSFVLGLTLIYAETASTDSLTKEDIQYPVPDLGNCKNETECRSYCDDVDHAKECFAFAKKYHLISEEEAEKAADHFLNVKNGPGGCDSGKSCEAYCSTVDHLDTCITFAEDTGYYSPKKLAEAKKFQALLKTGTQFPGNCTDRNACEMYCANPDHMEECLNFAEKSGFMSPEEITEARKFMTLMQKGESPGGCVSKEQCENYCFEDSHIDECIAFAQKAGVMSAEDAQVARKVGGKGPGNCRSKMQCETYCEHNSEECFRFAQDHGLINENDLHHMREGMVRFHEELDKMPPEAVQCMKSAAGEENFNKMVAGEPVFDRSIEEKMKSCFGQVTAQFSQETNNLPPEVAQCIKNAVGDEEFKKLQSGEHSENLNFESLENCLQQLRTPSGSDSNFGGGEFSGPGGCANAEECAAYCMQNYQDPACQKFMPPAASGSLPANYQQPYQQEHDQQQQEHSYSGSCETPEECQKVAPPATSSSPSQDYRQQYQQEQTPFSGPGGCANAEECAAYCMQNYQDPACQKFMPPATSGSLLHSPLMSAILGPWFPFLK